MEDIELKSARCVSVRFVASWVALVALCNIAQCLKWMSLSRLMYEMSLSRLMYELSLSRLTYEMSLSRLTYEL